MRQQKLQTINRRTFLSGGRESGGETPALRPPWTDERTVVSQCSACGDCVRACPESILIAGDGGLPEISFQYGACTFCGDCAAACEEQVFDAGRDRPWSLKVSITGACLLKSGVTCQSCTDVCDADALRFNLRIQTERGNRGRPRRLYGLRRLRCPVSGCRDCDSRTGFGGDVVTESVHISSLLVSAHPKVVERVASGIEAIGIAEVAHTDPLGKIIVTLETADESAIVQALTDIQLIEGVVSAALVFHQVDDTAAIAGTGVT